MKHQLLYILLLFFCSNLLAQTRDFNVLVNGRVSDRNFKQAVIKARIILATDNGMIEERYSDSVGYYEFKFQKVAFTSGTLSIATDKQTTRYGWMGDITYLGSKDLGIFSCKPEELPKHLIKDFELEEAIVCGPAPTLHFKKNSVVFDTVTYFNETEYPLKELQALKKTLDQNLNIVIQISGHCSKGEKNPKRLSKQRAEQIKKKLVEMEIPEPRLKTKGYGCKRPIVSNEEIKNAATEKEKATLCSKNRRATFSIISFGKEKKEEEEDE